MGDKAGAAGECPELGGEAAGTTIQYYVDGVADTSVAGGGFGLDSYEPLFFNSQDWWKEKNTANAYKVTLKVPADATYTKIYYFCHIHAGMSAEIEITGSSATAAKTVIHAAVLGSETEATALAIFTKIQTDDQKSVATFDQACGTYNTYAKETKSTCSNSHFLCGD